MSNASQNVTVTVVDDEAQAGVAFSSSTPTVHEGTTGTYTVRLNTRPTQNVTIAVTSDNQAIATVSPPSLTFTNENWVTARTVTMRGVQDSDEDDETVSLNHVVTSTDPNYNSLTLTALRATVTDDDKQPRVTVTPTTLNINEGGTGFYTMALSTQPSEAVTISVLGPGFGQLGNLSLAIANPVLRFTTSNWRTLQTVTVRGIEDANAVNEVGVSVTHFVRGDAVYAALTPPSVTVNFTDNDTPGVTVSLNTLAVNEGETGEYGLSLSTLPTAPVTISVSNPDASAVTLSATSLTFTTDNWNSVQTVTVSGVEDTDVNDETVQLTHTATSTDPGYNGGTVTISAVAVTVDDDDTAGVTVSPNTLAAGEAGSGEYTLRLNTPPANDVTINVSNPDASAVTLSATSLTFTTDNWNSVQMVTVSGVEDTDANDETVQLTHTATSTDPDYNGGAVTISAVAVTVDDDETAGVTVSPTTLAVGEAGSGEYTLRLNTPPANDVTINVSNPDATAVTLSATSLTFTTDNWNSVQTVTVSGVEDTDADHETVQLTHTATSTDADYASGVTIDSVAVTLNDNDTPGVTVSTTTLTVNERGGTGMYTLRLNTPPTEAVTISVTHSNAAAATVSPTSLMFGTTDWNTAKTITVTGVEDADTDNETVQLTHTVTSTDTTYRTVTAATVTVTVTEMATVSLDVDGSGGDPNQSDGLLLGRYLFGIRDAAGLLDTIPGSPSASAVTANIAGAFASGRLDVDGSGGDPNQSDGLLLGRYLFGIRDAVGLLDTIPGNPSFNAVRTNIEALLQ